MLKPVVQSVALARERSRRRHRRSTRRLLSSASLATLLALSPALHAQEAAGASGEESAPFLFALAKAEVVEGNASAALDYFGRAVELDPEAVYLRVEYASFLLRLQRVEDALEQVEVALELAPEDVEVLRTYGQATIEKITRGSGSLEEALDPFERLKELAPDDAAAMVPLSRIYSQLGRHADAADTLEELVSHHTDNRQLKRILVEALGRAGREDRAQELLEEVLELDGRSLESRLSLAEIESGKGNHSAALDILRAADADLQRDPRLQGVIAQELFLRALSPGVSRQRRESDLSEALETLEGMPDDQTFGSRRGLLQSQVLAELGRFEEAVELLQSLQRRYPQDRQIPRALTRLLASAGDPQAAIDNLKGLISSEDDDGERHRLRLQLAELLARQGRFEDLEGLGRSMLGATQDDHRWQGVNITVGALVELDRFRDAVRLLDGEQGKEGPSRRVSLRRGEVYAAWGKKRAAVQSLETEELSIEQLLADEDYAGVFRKAEVYLLLEDVERVMSTMDGLADGGELIHLRAAAQFFSRDGWFHRSIPYLERAAAMPEADEDSDLQADLQFGLGQAEERSRRYEAAAARFKKVLELQPDNAAAMNYLGYMWADNNENLEEALSLVERAVEIDPDNGAYVDSLGWALYRLGRFEEAQEQLERAAELVPEDSTIYEHLGDIYRALGKYQRARASYERALGLPDLEDEDAVRRKLGELPGGG